MSAFDMTVDLKIDFAKVSAECKEALERAIIDTVEMDIKPDAVEKSPYLTGKNRASIETQYAEGQDGTTMDLFTTSGYGGYLEAGTRKMAARPYLYPAYEAHKKDFFDRLREIIRSFGGAK
jgi:HK97 gp10 family phage protein